jgi:phosphatidylglycerophosphatase C
VVAAFDVDRTVTSRDCVVPFMMRVGGRVRVAASLGRTGVVNLPVVLRRDRDRFKALAAHAVFRGRSMADVERHADDFVATLTGARLRDDVLERMRWHHDQGHAVVWVSASFAVYLRPLAARLGIVDAVLGTELAVAGDGRCSGELLGANCRGPEKVKRLHAWLGERYGGRSAVELWAYGDSAGDRELLADADHGVWAKSTLAVMPEPVQ